MSAELGPTLDEFLGDDEEAKEAKRILRLLGFPEALGAWSPDQFEVAEQLLTRLGDEAVDGARALEEACFDQHGVYLDVEGMLAEEREGER